MLRMEHVTKQYRHRGQLVTALDGATVSIAKGDFVAVVGPSGSGKSTLLLLSVGQQQRVALARMLANDPAVILADEPTGNLDPETTQHVIEFLEEVNGEGRTIVMVTHDPRAAQRAKRTLRLTGGAILSEKQVKEELHVA